MMAKKKTTKKKAPRSGVAKDEESSAPVEEKAPESKAPVKKASKKASKKDDGRPAGAPPADHCDAEWETDTHHIYKLKFEHVGDDNQRKIKIAK
jgi:hypothetical protein